MMKRLPAFAGILLLTVFLLLGCGKSREKEMGEKELVRVNDVSISLMSSIRSLRGNPWKERCGYSMRRGSEIFSKIMW